ncbi:choice-of-anchor Q domain-containing protein [Edaphobacter sp. DSM 109919]|uniref:Choice-of-anchor Q domain-containing protein n=2 Tax=Edaphobacter paludis TaxID=3035702 RepID=A0AAU7CXI4_9BACT
MVLKRCAIGVFCLLFIFLTVGPRQTQPVQAAAKLTEPPSTRPSLSTWFVRQDGGDRKQCTGRADAPYSGRGSKQPCALNHPYYLFTSQEQGDDHWIIGGGDTVIIRGGPYRMGYKGPNPNDGWGSCAGDPYRCSMPPVPSGTADHPTRLLGENYASCNKKTQLFGGYGLDAIIVLGGSQHVDIECLELTDHGQCTRAGAGYPASEGCSSSYPLSDYASIGIVTSNKTADVTLRNLDIHGLTSRGILGAIGGVFTVDHVRLGFNGMAGWDFDDGNGTASSPDATVNASYLTVEWSGCNEEYPISHSTPAFSCFDQNDAGYGDGVGTSDTPLNFTCDHCVFRYNTQDGFDLLHTSGSLISIKNSSSYGNMGQQWKFGAMKGVVFQNNLTVNNCSRMSAPFPGAPEGYHRYLSLFCRAAGEGIAFRITDSGTYLFQNNSFAGYGTTSYDISCWISCKKATVTYQNNLNIGYKNPADREVPAVFYFDNVPGNPFVTQDHNIYYNMRSCPSGSTQHCSDPKIVRMPVWNGEASLDDIDFHLTASSPARGGGVAPRQLPTDHDGVPLPAGAGYDIGAFHFHP